MLLKRVVVLRTNYLEEVKIFTIPWVLGNKIKAMHECILASLAQD